MVATTPGNPKEGQGVFVNSHFGVDVTELYSPPRVTKEAELQNSMGLRPEWRVGQALDLTTV